MEANLYLKVLPRERVKALLLHEVLTELIVAYSLVELLEELQEYVERKLEVSFGLETRNIGQLRRFLKENGIQVDYIMTPMNPLGYQMAPSKEEAEEAIQELGDQGVKIIAVNILASGAVSLEETCRYLEGYGDRVYAVAYGTVKPYRARENAIKFRQCLL
jgi:uroporphyrinogen-III synthase